MDQYITINKTAVQSQMAVSAYFTSKQILPFGFAEQNRPTNLFCTANIVENLFIVTNNSNILTLKPLN